MHKQKIVHISKFVIFAVRDSPVDLNLGVEFLKRAEVYLCFSENCIHVGGPRGTKVTFLGTKEFLQLTKSASRFLSSNF